MLGALIIVFREVIEAGLIVGIVLAVTKGLAGGRLAIAAGVLAGVVGASLVAAFAGAIGEALRHRQHDADNEAGFNDLAKDNNQRAKHRRSLTKSC